MRSVESAPAPGPLAKSLGAILLVVTMFFLNFMGRVVLGPLMPVVEADLRIGHAEAGSLFLLISVGYCVGLLVNGSVSARLTHRRTIALASVIVGASLFTMAGSRAGWGLQGGLVLLGLGSGMYLPSGVATITSLVEPRDWGKALALHEFAPNAAFTLAPVIAEVLLARFSWRGALVATGAAAIGSAALFRLRGRGGSTRGRSASRADFRALAGNGSFWIISLLFAAGIATTFGVYTMLPLYLTADQGLTRPQANGVLAFARFLTLAAVFGSGWVTDRLGARRALVLVLGVGGGLTVLLGVASPEWVAPMVILQSMVTAWFFPPAFSALSSIGPLALSFAIPIATVLGAGVVPTVVGALGERGAFGEGMALIGAMALGCAALASRIRGKRPSS